MAATAATLLSRSFANLARDRAAARAGDARRRGPARRLLDILAETSRSEAQVALDPYRPRLDREPTAMAERRIGPGHFHR